MKRLKINGEEVEIRISPSFLQNAACPLYMRFRYVDKLDDRYIRIGAERGKTAHAVIAELIQLCLAEKIEVEQIPDEALRASLLRHLPPYIMSETALILDWMMLWRARFRLPRNIHGIEDKVALDEEYEECRWDDASYRGIIDLRQISNTHAVITDWKSQPHIISQTELNEDEQGTIYCFLTWKQYPQLKTFTFRRWYLRYGFYSETSRTEEDLEKFEIALAVRERKIAEYTDWSPQPGPHCHYCEYIHRCSIALDLSPANPQIITQEQATLAGQRVVVLESLLKQLKGGLKEYVNANDNVRLGDRFEYGFHKHGSTVWDPEEVESVLEENDRKLSEVAGVQAKKMTKLIKQLGQEDPELGAALEELGRPKYRTTFEGARVGSVGDKLEEGEGDLEVE